MKAYGGVDVYTNIFLTSALGGGEWSASRPLNNFLRYLLIETEKNNMAKVRSILKAFQWQLRHCMCICENVS
jgi:hypothetical protein